MAVAFVGPIPPASGPARDDFLKRRARIAAGNASRAYFDAVTELEQALGSIELPQPATVSDTIHARLGVWEPIRAALAGHSNRKGDLPGERSARLALACAIDACWDLSQSDRANQAHQRVHILGEMVSGLYCCFLDWDVKRKLWFDCCPVKRSHSAIGVSPGFTADIVCSICGDDAAECEHLPDHSYPVAAQRDDAGVCLLCHLVGCAHIPDATYDVYPQSALQNIQFLEASLTPLPREPRARVTGIEAEPQPPPPSRAGDKRRCVECLLACSGFTPGPIGDPGAVSVVDD